MNRSYNIIREKVHAHEDPVPGDAWDNILNKKRKKRFGFAPASLCMMICALLITAYYFGAQKQTKTITLLNSLTSEIYKNPGGIIAGDKKQKLVDKGTVSLHQLQNYAHIAIEENETAATKSTKNLQKGLHAVFSATRDITVSDKTENSTRHKSNKSLQTKARESVSIVENEAVETEEFPRAKNIDKEKIINPNEKKEAITKVSADHLRDNSPVTETEKHSTVFLTDSVLQKSNLAPVQNNNDKAIDRSKSSVKNSWFIDVAVTPEIIIASYDHSILYNRAVFLPESNTQFSGRVSYTHINPSAAFSVNLRKVINTRLNAGIGIQYRRLKEFTSITGQQVSTFYRFAANTVDNLTGPQIVKDTTEIILSEERKFNAINNYTFVSIPVFIQYSLLRKDKWSVGIDAGTKINIISRYENNINNNTIYPLLIEPYKASGKTNIGFSLYAGLRAERKLNKKLALFILPSFTYSPSAQSIKNTLIQKKIHSAGIGFGISGLF